MNRIIVFCFFLFSINKCMFSSDSFFHGLSFLYNKNIFVVEEDRTIRQIKGMQNIIKYALAENKMYLLVLNEKENGGAIEYKLTYCDFDPLIDDNFENIKEVNIKNPNSIQLSLDNNYLLVTQIDNSLITNYFIINTRTDDVLDKHKLQGLGVIGWCSNNELLCVNKSDLYRINSNELFVYNVENSKLKKLKNNFDFIGKEIRNAKKNRNSNYIIEIVKRSLDNNYVPEGDDYQLMVFGENKSNYLDSTSGGWYYLNDDNSVVTIRYNRNLAVMEIVQFNINGKLIRSINLNEKLKNKDLEQGIAISENTLDNSIVIYSWSPNSGEGKFFKINITNIGEIKYLDKMGILNYYLVGCSLVMF